MNTVRTVRQRVRRGTNRVVRWWALLITAPLVALGQSALPPEVQADMLQRRIVEALKREDVRTALAAFDEYRKLELAMPPPLLFLEAKAASDAGQAERAFDALEEFLKVSPREGRQYQEALDLYEPYQKAAAAARGERAKALLATIERDMVAIPAGQFQMGDLSGRGQSDEKPVRTVTVGAFRLAKHEVTFEQYDIYAQAAGRPLPDDKGWGRGHRPVIHVSWEDAQGFIVWLNQQTQGRYRLPTETEWEYAARAGTTTVYPWGDAFDPSRANGSGQSGADQWTCTRTYATSAPTQSASVWRAVAQAKV